MTGIMIPLEQLLSRHADEFGMILRLDYRSLPFLEFDLTQYNSELANLDIENVEQFNAFSLERLRASGARFGIGRYNEERVIYDQRPLFSGDEPRRIHLGIDLFVEAGQDVMAPLDSRVHSFANNAGQGDYGPTIILEHELEGRRFHTLYGHLSLDSLEGLKNGRMIEKGEIIGHIGSSDVNGKWPPHLHFQIIEDMLGKEGDFPGVCSLSDRAGYLSLCPDPDLILRISCRKNLS